MDILIIISALLLLAFLAIGLPVFCLLALCRKKARLLPLFGLLLSASVWAIVLYVFAFLGPTGSAPNFLNRHKFIKQCPRSAFWLDYDPDHLEKLGVPALFSGSGASLLFVSAAEHAYEPENLIAFAQDHGWQYVGRAELKKSHLLDYIHFRHRTLNPSFPRSDPNVFENLYFIFANNFGDIWLNDSCTALAFNSNHGAGVASYVFIENNQETMLVHGNADAFIPDVYDLTLPAIFRDPDHPDPNIHYLPEPEE